jgi:hypothetical protein
MIAFLIFVAVTAGGTAATYLDDGRVSLTTRIAAGACVGLTALGLLGFLAASVFGFTLLVLALCAAAIAAPLALLGRRKYRLRMAADARTSVERVIVALRGGDPHALIGFISFLLLGALLSIVFASAVYQTPDGVYTGTFVNRNDLPLHIGIIEGFLGGHNFPPQHPEFAGARLTYPFLVDFIAAQFALTGLSLPAAVAFENLLLMAVLLVLLHRWARALTGDRGAALITPMLVLLGSGLGWALLVADFRSSGAGFFTFLWHLPHDYTINTRHLRWGNLTTTVLVSQRSFLLGLPLALIVWTLWWRAVGRDGHAGAATAGDRSRFRIMAAAGVVAGSLPLAHTHTFMVLMAMAGILSVLFRAWRAWFLFFALAMAIAIPQLWWVSQGSLIENRTFVGWSPGWTKGSASYAWFWFKNTGLFIPLLVAAIAFGLRRRLVSSRLLLFHAPFLLCFIVPQLFRLAPRPAANIKVLIYWYIASAPLVALLLARWWRSGGFLRTVAVASVLTLTAAATLDVWRIVSGASAVKVFDAASVEFAEQVQRHTPPGAVIVHAPSRNHPIFLTGRYSLLGNLLHVSSHGFNYRDRVAEISHIYAGRGSEMLQRGGVDYIVVGPQEREALHASDAVFARLPLVVDAGGYRLYQAPPPRPPYNVWAPGEAPLRPSFSDAVRRFVGNPYDIAAPARHR